MIEKMMTYLNDSGYSAHLQLPNDTFDFSEIWINLNENIILKVHCKGEIIPSEDSLVNGSMFYFFHFFVAFDRVVEKELFGDAARVCTLLNKVIPLGAFGFSEADQLFTYSYIYPVKELDANILDIIFSSILYSVELYTPTLLEFSGMNSLLK